MSPFGIGEWHVESDEHGPYIVENRGGRVATVECWSFARNGGSLDWKRARLIAAAPDLLKACELALADHESAGPCDCETCGELRRAIAKATCNPNSKGTKQ